MLEQEHKLEYIYLINKSLIKNNKQYYYNNYENWWKFEQSNTMNELKISLLLFLLDEFLKNPLSLSLYLSFIYLNPLV